MAKASIKSPMNGAEKLIIFRFPAVNGWASGKFIATLDSHFQWQMTNSSFDDKYETVLSMTNVNDKWKMFFFPSPRLPVSPSPRLPFSRSGTVFVIDTFQSVCRFEM